MTTVRFKHCVASVLSSTVLTVSATGGADLLTSDPSPVAARRRSRSRHVRPARCRRQRRLRRRRHRGVVTRRRVPLGHRGFSDRLGDHAGPRWWGGDGCHGRRRILTGRRLRRSEYYTCARPTTSCVRAGERSQPHQRVGGRSPGIVRPGQTGHNDPRNSMSPTDWFTGRRRHPSSPSHENLCHRVVGRRSSQRPVAHRNAWLDPKCRLRSGCDACP